MKSHQQMKWSPLKRQWPCWQLSAPPCSNQMMFHHHSNLQPSRPLDSAKDHLASSPLLAMKDSHAHPQCLPLNLYRRRPLHVSTAMVRLLHGTSAVLTFKIGRILVSSMELLVKPSRCIATRPLVESDTELEGAASDKSAAACSNSPRNRPMSPANFTPRCNPM